MRSLVSEIRRKRKTGTGAVIGQLVLEKEAEGTDLQAVFRGSAAGEICRLHLRARHEGHAPCHKSKLLMIQWIPDNAAVKLKIVYASTKEMLKSKTFPKRTVLSARLF